MAEKLVITAALAGSVTKKEHNPNVPYTPEEFVREARRAEEAGAAVVHVHFRDPVTGKPTTDPAIMAEVVQAIRENTHLLLNLSTGVSLESTPRRAQAADRAARSPSWPRSIPGTMNFCTVNYRDGRIIEDKTYYNPLRGTLEFGTLMQGQGHQARARVLRHLARAQRPLLRRALRLPGGAAPLLLRVRRDGRRALQLGHAQLLHPRHPARAPPGRASAPARSVSRWRMACAVLRRPHPRRAGRQHLHRPTDQDPGQGNWDLVEKAVQIARLAGREPASPDEARQILQPAEPDRGSRMRSDQMKTGLKRAQHRALFYSMGYTRREIEQPIVGVVNSFNQIIPGHIHLNQIVEAVVRGVSHGRAARR